MTHVLGRVFLVTLIVTGSEFIAIARGEGSYVNTVYAAASTTTTRKLIDTPLASVIGTSGQVKLVRTAANTWQATGNTNCPDGVTYPNAYAKCFTSASAYSQQCTGSNYCGDNTSWNSSTNKCTGTPATDYCGAGTKFDTVVNKCIICTTPSYSSYSYDSATSSYKDDCNNTGYYLGADGSYYTGCNGTLSGGFCWDTLDNNTYTWANRNNGCDSGYSVPTTAQFNTFLSNMGTKSQIYTAWGLSSSRRFWSATENDSTNAHYMYVDSTFTYINYYSGKGNQGHVRCIRYSSGSGSNIPI